MKKCFKILALLLVLLGFLSCENPIDPSQGGSNAFLDGGVNLNIEKVEGATWCDISRSKGNEEYSFYMSLNNYTNVPKTIVDYFVNPGETYKYRINYYNTPEGTITKEVEKTAVVGVGELSSVTKPSATYDEKTGKMTFTTLPKFPDAINTFIENSTNCEGTFDLSYWHEGYGNVLYVNNIKEVIDCPKYMNDNTDSYYGKPLTINGFNARVYINGVSYNKYLQQEEIGTIPETIVVPDTRKTVEFDTTCKDGVLIKVPNEARNAERVEITRNIKVTDKDNKWHYENSESINIYDFKNKNINVIPDYFVDKNKEYYYTAIYRDDNWNKLYETKPTKIIPTSGQGEIQSVTHPAATYNPTTGIMTFSVLPEFSSYIHDLDSKPSSGRWSNYKYFKICYNRPNWGWVINTDIEKETDMSAAIDNEENFNKELDLVGINARLRINDIEYSSTKKIPGLPEKINIPDTRVDISVKQVENGIEITLPATVPARTERFSIGRVNVNHPSNNNDMRYWYINCNDLKKNVITDYFVKPGMTYEYTLYYRYDSPSDNGKVLKKSKPVNIKVEKGLGEGFIKPGTKVDYNESTGIMSLDPIPDYSVIKNIMTENDTYNASLFYRTSNGNDIWGSIKEDGTINWSEELSNRYNGSDFGKPLTLNGFNMEVNLTGVRYQQWIYKEDLKKIVPTIPETIKVNDTRTPLILKSCDEGILIQFPECNEDNIMCNIRRRVAGSDNDWDIISINSSDFKGDKRKQIIDYFVNPNVVYEYYLYFDKLVNNRWEKVLTTQINSIKAQNGKGELGIKNRPKITFNADKNKFYMEPTINKNDILAGINATNKNLYCSISYRTEKNGDDWFNASMNDNGEFSFNNSDELIFDKPLYFRSFSMSAEIDSVRFEQSYNLNESNNIFSEIPHEITLKDTRFEIKANNVSNGIEIILPSNVPQKTDYISIRRRTIGKNDDYYITSKDLSKKVINDYFVKPSEKYAYTLYYRQDTNHGSENISESKPFEITATSGLSKDYIKQGTKVTYDEKTNIMTFTPAPDKTEINKILGPKGNFSATVAYERNSNGGWIWGRLEDNGTINWQDAISENFIEFEKDLFFMRLDIEVTVDNVNYGKRMPREYVQQIIPSFPQTIKIFDKREKLKLESLAEGIKIYLPAINDNGELDCNIYKRIKGQNGKWNSITIDNYHNTEKEIIDKFVSPNKIYEYYLGIRKRVENGNGWNWKNLYVSQIAEVNSIGGSGDLTIKGKPTITFVDNKLKINPIPNKEEYLKVLQGNNKSIRFNAIYNTNLNNMNSFYMKSNGEFEYNGTFNPIFYEKDLYFRGFNIYLYNDSISYHIDFTKEECNSLFTSFPEVIKFQDTRKSLTCEQSNDGIIIKFPQLPDDSIKLSCSITKRVVGSDNTTSETIFSNQDCFHGEKRKQIVDYFVEPNVEYEYEATIYTYGNMNNENKYMNLKPTRVVATNGKGELKSITVPKATYDPKTGVMSFSVLPKLSDSITNFITNYHNRIDFNITYSDPQGKYVINCPIEEKLNLSDKVFDSNFYGKEIGDPSMNLDIFVDGLIYQKDIVGNIPSSIIVNKPKTIN